MMYWSYQAAQANGIRPGSSADWPGPCICRSAAVVVHSACSVAVHATGIDVLSAAVLPGMEHEANFGTCGSLPGVQQF
jgi:hypothetical protein